MTGFPKGWNGAVPWLPTVHRNCRLPLIRREIAWKTEAPIVAGESAAQGLREPVNASSLSQEGPGPGTFARLLSYQGAGTR